MTKLGAEHFTYMFDDPPQPIAGGTAHAFSEADGTIDITGSVPGNAETVKLRFRLASIDDNTWGTLSVASADTSKAESDAETQAHIFGTLTGDQKRPVDVEVGLSEDNKFQYAISAAGTIDGYLLGYTAKKQRVTP